MVEKQGRWNHLHSLLDYLSYITVGELIGEKIGRLFAQKSSSERPTLGYITAWTNDRVSDHPNQCVDASSALPIIEAIARDRFYWDASRRKRRWKIVVERSSFRNLNLIQRARFQLTLLMLCRANCAIFVNNHRTRMDLATDAHRPEVKLDWILLEALIRHQSRWI